MATSTVKRLLVWLRGLFSRKPASDDNSTWCLVGNVVEEHPYSESGELKRGTKHFTPGTKVYCLPVQWGDGYEQIVVVGIARRSRRWITVVMPSDYITNWRAMKVYQPSVLRRLRAGYNGFNGQWKSRRQVESYVKALEEHARKR